MNTYSFKVSVTREEEVFVDASSWKEAHTLVLDSNNWIDYSYDGPILDVELVKELDIIVDEE